jgi:dihydroorotase
VSQRPRHRCLNTEEEFLPALQKLHERFPTLKIILEHCTTGAAINAVKSCGPIVAAIITAHHLYLTIDDVIGDARSICKPIAKREADRKALLQAIVSGNTKLFFWR